MSVEIIPGDKAWRSHVVAILCRKAWAKICFDKVRADTNSTPEQWREAYKEFRAASRQLKKLDDAQGEVGE